MVARFSRRPRAFLYVIIIIIIIIIHLSLDCILYCCNTIILSLNNTAFVWYNTVVAWYCDGWLRDASPIP